SRLHPFPKKPQQTRQQDRPTQDAQDPGNHAHSSVILDHQRAVVLPTQNKATMTAEERRAERRLLDAIARPGTIGMAYHIQHSPLTVRVTSAQKESHATLAVA